MLRTIMENCVPIMIKYAICTPANGTANKTEREKTVKKYINGNKLQCEFGKKKN